MLLQSVYDVNKLQFHHQIESYAMQIWVLASSI